MRLNPFAELTREIAEKVLKDHRLKRQAEQRLATLLTTYRELAEDPRYRALYEELKLLMGEQLRQLVERAVACQHCSPYANRIQVMQECIAVPLETVWFERQQEVQAEEDGGEEPVEANA